MSDTKLDSKFPSTQERDGQRAKKWACIGLADAVDEEEATKAHACCRQIRMLDVESGELVTIRCGTRSEKRCPGCAWLYKKDTAKLLRSGLIRGGAYRFFLLTLTAPSFGRCHVVPKRDERKKCGCGTYHDAVKDVDLRGVPLDITRYAYDRQVAFNYHIGKLWNATLALLRKHYPDMAFAKVFEWQQRGALHVHALLRFRAADFVAAGDPADIIRRMALSVRAMHQSMYWGNQCKCDEIRGAGQVDGVIGYLKKAVAYVTKDVCESGPDGSGRNRMHLAMLDYSASTMRCDRCDASYGEAIRSLAAQQEGIAEKEISSRLLMGIAEGVVSCKGLPHRRWGARAGVMTMSRGTENRDGWSLEGLSRTMLANRRHEWYRSRAEQMKTVCGQLQDISLTALVPAPA